FVKPRQFVTKEPNKKEQSSWIIKLLGHVKNLFHHHGVKVTMPSMANRIKPSFYTRRQVLKHHLYFLEELRDGCLINRWLRLLICALIQFFQCRLRLFDKATHLHRDRLTIRF